MYKRALAFLLATVLAFTPVLSVNAAETTSNIEMTEMMTEVSSEEADPAEKPEVSAPSEKTQAPEETQNPGAVSEESSMPEETQTPVETSAPAETNAPEETPEAEVPSAEPAASATPEETPWESATPEAEPIESESPAERTSPEESAVPEETPEENATPEETPEESLSPDESASPEESLSPDESATPEETEVAVDNPLMTDEVRAFIDAVKAEAPVYGDFLEKSSSIPVAMAFNQEADLMGDGQITTVYMEIGMASFDQFYVSTDSLGAPMDIIITDGKYYMVSAEEKTAIYMEMSAEEAAEMNESMTASVKASFDASAATYETGETEFKGATYYYEKIATDEMGEIEVYADPATKELKYLVSQGITMELVFITDEIDASKLEIPADYTLIDMAEMMG